MRSGRCRLVHGLSQVSAGCMTAVFLTLALVGEAVNDDALPAVFPWVAGGVACGSLLAARQRHPRRILGLVPPASTGLAVGLISAAAGLASAPWLCVLLGVMAGLVTVPLVAAFLADGPVCAPLRSPPLRGMVPALVIGVLAGLTLVLARAAVLGTAGQLWLFAGLAAAGAALSWRLLLREFLEQVVEVLLSPFYRVRGRGPGLDRFPPRGPLLVLANHAAWFDPLFLAKVLPRRLLPMMTSVFYDLPVLRWLMRVAHAIRVQASTYRREAPELAQAIAALDRGECVVIFPEGAMRRREDQPLRLFGQGVWHILKERPQTPVIVCWIEGNWGCYFSYFNGPPTRNKRMDWRRRIDVGISLPQLVEPAILADQRHTRVHLMQACLEARRHLGLEPLRMERLEVLAEEEAAKTSSESV